LLFAELNHRIKNNMQMLHALLASARRETDSDEARKALGEAAARVSSMAAAQTALYQSQVSRFDALGFLEAVSTSAKAACPAPVALEIVSDSIELANDHAVPLALILNELITNAVKHAAAPAGSAAVRVRLAESEGWVTLSVEDDGPGFDFNEARRRSSGLGLVAGLARQIGGSFAVESDKGARCLLRFPDKPRLH